MNKQVLLPKLAVMGIKKNGDTYFPYMIAGIFSVFVFFVFSSIMYNDIMETVPHSGYVIVLMTLGLVLLGMILIPFLIYTNSFLIKRRKKELGLYSILGLEKKHIAIMMFWETIIVFSVVIVAGILFGLVFSKLLFLLLLNLSGIPIETKFNFSFKAFKLAIIFFLLVYGINLLINWVVVFKSNPNELIKGAKKGDKEPKYLWFTSLVGVTALAIGYYIAMISQINSMIFIHFFLAVALVVIGTHYFFTAGIVALLKGLKGNKQFYYKKSNYVTLSGMLHRMKKSASSLANICIFSTMTIITLLCTLSLWSGTGGILDYQYPYDIVLNFEEGHLLGNKAIDKKLDELSKSTQVDIEDKISFAYQELHVQKEENRFIQIDDATDIVGRYTIKLITLQDYNNMEGTTEQLEMNEMMVFTRGSDFAYTSMVLGQEQYTIKKELKESVLAKKASNNHFSRDFYLIVKDETVVERMKAIFESNEENDHIDTMRFRLEGEDTAKVAFIKQLGTWAHTQKGFSSMDNGIANRQDTIAVNGGLLFIGIFFGIVFTMCLILIMYYKQITEGIEDRENFNIMQKVGMSNTEVKSTIKRQILVVFFMPLCIAIIHTMVAFKMIAELFSAIHLYDKPLMAVCSIVVIILFTLLYSLSYLGTSKSYYNIVKQMD